MGRKILVEGETGTGKSHSFMYLNPQETVVISPDEKELPFKGWRKNYKTVLKEDGNIDPNETNFYKQTDFSKITKFLNYVSSNRSEIKYVIIDTITLAQIKSFMDHAKIRGFDKFTDMALEVYNLFKTIDSLREDLIVFVLAHTDREDLYGVTKTKFAVPGGKLIGEKIKPESMFTVVLETEIEFKDDKANYYFITQNNGMNSAKSPQGMFERRIPNNLQYVVDAIDKYENEE